MTANCLLYPCLVLATASCLALAPAAAMPYHSTQGVLHTRPSLNDFLTTYLQAAQQRAEPQYGYPEYQPPYQQASYQQAYQPAYQAAYQPSYQQGYLAHRPRRVQQQQQQNYEPLIQYLNSADVQQDYPSYDLSGSDPMYPDPEGTWYDDSSVPAGAVIGSPSYVPQVSAADVTSDFLSSEPTEQDLALAQLMLDHIAGKYSLEDLETLEREARLEENTENQLRALTKKVHRKKSMVLPYLSRSVPSRSSLKHGTPNPGLPKPVVSRVASVPRATPEGLLTMTQRRGQKEEPVVVPATNVRRPVFVQHLEQSAPFITEVETSNAALEGINKKSSSVTTPKDVSSTSSSHASSTAGKTSSAQVANILKSASSSPVFTSSSSSKASRPRTTGVVEVVKVEDEPLPPSPRGGSAASTAGGSSGGTAKTEREVQSAYEALKHYLDTEREARMLDDQELLRSPQKRFVKDDDPLQRELYNLKKTVA